MRRFISLIIAIPLIMWLLRQCRRPSGVLGARVAVAMNIAHGRLTEWGLTHVEIAPTATLLDIGCGGGRTVQTLAALAPHGRVCGVDYSLASVATSRRTNADAISSGRVLIALASVAALPFGDATFDVVTAIETHYYWPDLDANMREVFRVLKPSGTFVLIAETVRDGQPNPLYRIMMPLLGAAHLTAADHRQLLTRAGLRNVIVDVRKNGWICATGHRPGG